MSPTPEKPLTALLMLEKALEEARQEEMRLRVALGQAVQLRESIEEAIHLQTKPALTKLKAPNGTLDRAIVDLLSKTGRKPLSNSDVRATLERQGYKWSLTPLHLTKTFTRLVKKKKVERVGDGAQAKYRIQL